MLIENIISILRPFEEMTKTISSDTATVANAIPNVEALKHLLGRQVVTDHGVKTMKNALLESVTKRFAGIYSDPLYCIATVLDLRYKCFYFDAGKKQSARDMIQAVLDKENPQQAAAHGTGDATPSDNDTDNTGNPEQSAAKRPRLLSIEEEEDEEEPKPPSLSDMFSEILEENTSETR